MELHKPVVFTNGGPWAEHDVVCPVCQVRSAVLDLDFGIYQPCWSCQQMGWRTRCLTRWQRRLADRFYQGGRVRVPAQSDGSGGSGQ